MQRWYLIRMVFFCLLLALVPIGITAQAALSQTYTAPDQSFTVKYPGGMTPTFNTSTPTDVLFFSDDRSVHSLSVEIRLATGAKTFADAVPILQAAINTTNTPTAMTVGDRQILYIEGGQGASDEVTIANTAILFSNGDLAIIVGRTVPDDFDEWKSVVLAMVDTLNLPNAQAVGLNAPAATTESGTAEATAETTSMPTAEVTSEATSTLSAPEATAEATLEATVEATAEATSAFTPSNATCLVTASPNNVNLRSGPGTDFDRTDMLAIGQTIRVDGQATEDDGAIWYHTSDGSWLRSNLVIAQAACANIPTITL